MTRRTGKAGEGAGNSGSSSNSANKVQSQLHTKAQEAGLVLADNFQAQMLMSAMLAIQSGYVGDRTQQLLEIMDGQTDSPLALWGDQLTWDYQDQLPSLPESSGSLS